MKIEGIIIEDKHKGEEVTYYEPYSGIADTGFISSWNETFIFVWYRKINSTQATRPEDLYWGDREGEFGIKTAIIKSLKVGDILDVNDFTIYTCGLLDNELTVSVLIGGEPIGFLRCNIHNDYYYLPECNDYFITKMRRKIQLAKLI